MPQQRGWHCCWPGSTSKTMLSQWEMPDGTALVEAILAQQSFIQGLILQSSHSWKKLGGFQQCLIWRLFMQANVFRTRPAKAKAFKPMSACVESGGLQLLLYVLMGFPPPALLETRWCREHFGPHQLESHCSCGGADTLAGRGPTAGAPTNVAEPYLFCRGGGRAL